jgi:endonuclease YncB( thermonuclease family)
MDYGILSRGLSRIFMRTHRNLHPKQVRAARVDAKAGLFALILASTFAIAGCSPVQLLTPDVIIVTATSLPPTEVPIDAAPRPQGAEHAHVVRVIDGDTIEVEMNGNNYRVRYIGMNTAETNQTCGSEGTEANAALVADQDVMMVKDVSETDRYRRLLRYVYVGDLFVNAELVRQGVAEAATYPPDVAHSDEFVQLAAQAREANLGCWATDVWQSSDAPHPTRSTTTQGAGAVGPCDCTGRDLDCGSFNTHDEAQACFDYCMAQGFGDTHELDGNNDNVACQSLP